MQNFSLRPCENHHSGDSKKHALGSRESSLSEKSVSGKREVEGRHAGARPAKDTTERLRGSEERRKGLPVFGSPLFCPVCVLVRKRSLPFLAPDPAGFSFPLTVRGETHQRMEAASRFQP